MKTLFIHIGTMKTGSTAIQEFLDINREILSQKGYIYRYMPFPQPRGLRGRVAKTHNGAFLHGTPPFVEGYSEEENKNYLEQGLSVLKEWFEEKDQIILTAESIFRSLLYSSFMDRVKEYADQEGICVKIIVYLRDQVSFAQSLYRQVIKGRLTITDSFCEFVDKEEFWFQYAKPLNYLGDLFGTDHILADVYDPAGWAKEGSSVYDRFMQALGLTLTEEYRVPEGITNPSISFNSCELKRIVNEAGVQAEYIQTPSAQNMFRKAVDFCSEEAGPQKYNYLSDEELQRFRERFADSNREVAERFFHRDQLFEEKSAKGELWEPDNPGMLHDTILFFSFLCADLKKRVDDQKKEIEELKKQSQRGFFSRLKDRIKRLFKK